MPVVPALVLTAPSAPRRLRQPMRLCRDDSPAKPSTLTEKVCRACGRLKSVEQFCRSARNADGRGSYCRDCDRTRSNDRLAAKQAGNQHGVIANEQHRECKECRITKPTSEFYRQSRGSGGLNPRCKSCVSKSGKENYRKSAGRTLIFEYLLTHPCVDCGESDPVVLEFDHRPGEVKVFTIGNPASRSRRMLDLLLIEIAKCDIRCANCHRRRTAKERGFWLDKLENK